MANKAEYEAVPESEARIISEPEMNPRETYPLQTGCHPSCSDTRDKVIKLPNPQAHLPYIQARQVEGAPTR